MNALSSPAVEADVDDGGRLVVASVPEQPKPEREVAVLVVGEERLVEPAGLEEGVTPVERGGRTARRSRLEVGLGQRTAVVARHAIPPTW